MQRIEEPAAAAVLSECSTLACAASMAWPQAARAQSGDAIDYDTARFERQLPATRASGPIALDGALDEPAWARRAVAQQLHPERSARGRAGHLRHRSARPLRRRGALLRRVRQRRRAGRHHRQRPEEGLQHRRAATAFASSSTRSTTSATAISSPTNPAGAKWDAQMANEGRENNANWDGIWDVRHADHRDRLVRGDPDSVPHAEVQRAAIRRRGGSTSSASCGG